MRPCKQSHSLQGRKSYLAEKGLERQVVRTATGVGSRSCGRLGRRERSRGTTGWSGCTHWRERSGTRLHTTHRAHHGIRVHSLYVPGAHTVEPTPLILMGINVERHHDFLSTLYVELSQAISTKHVEHQFLRILLMRFDDKRLSLPLASGRDTASFRQNGNDLSL